MKINLKKEKFSDIENAFRVLRENPSVGTATEIIAESLKACFGVDFSVHVVTRTTDEPFFVMSVFPERSTMDKIIDACLANKTTDAIKKLWEDNKKWVIEIDRQTLNTDEAPDLNEKELTAILLHEVGHVACSTSLPNRISLILRYELVKSKASTKMLLKDKIFKRIMSLPILDACVSDSKRDKSSIKEEIKADAFAKKMGYSRDLQSALNKLINCESYPTNGTINDKMKQVSAFSISTIEDFQQRRDKLAKKHLLSIKEGTASVYTKEIIDEFIETIFEDAEDGAVINGRKVMIMQERADKCIQDGYFTEFFIFGGKQLKRIDPAEIDYIAVKTNEIHNDSDKMMLISYLHSKLDLVEYYISIMENPSLAKKYSIPHTLNQLYDIRKRLQMMRMEILNYKIPERNKNILVSWPSGYEG